MKKWKDEIKRQGELLDFLCSADRSSIVFGHKIYGSGYVNHYAKFIYNKHLNIVELPHSINSWYEVVEDNEYYFVIKETSNIRATIAYYKVEKESKQLTSITDFYKEKKTEEPPTVANPDTPTSMRDTMNELGIKGLNE